MVGLIVIFIGVAGLLLTLLVTFAGYGGGRATIIERSDAHSHVNGTLSVN